VPSTTVLVAAQDFGKGLDGAKVAEAIGRGLTAARPDLDADPCPIDVLPTDLDARMHRARAVVIAAKHLDHETLLRRDNACEVATRARQTGVPCYAVAASVGLDLFEARILDLQVVLEAASGRALTVAGRELAPYCAYQNPARG
jgi:glycerate kinase